MDKHLRFWKLTVILLVVLNVSMMVTFAYRTDSGSKKNDMERPDAFIIRTLKFTDAQTEAYIQLRNKHHESMLTLNAAGRQLRKIFFANLKLPDQARQTDSLAGLIAANQKEIEKVTYYHFVQVRALCNNEQEAIFDNIIADVLNKMAGPMRGDGPGGPGRPDGPGGEGPPPPHGVGPPPNDEEPPPGR